MRLEMLEEAIEVIRELWQGEFTYHYGKHYTVENAAIYTRPETPPPIYVSAFGDKSFDLALRVGDGFITTQPDGERGPGLPAIQGRQRQARPGRLQGLRGRHRGRGRRRSRTGSGRTPVLPGELSQVLPIAQALRAGQRTGHAEEMTATPSPAAPTSTATSRRSRRTPTPASTRCTWGTWDRTTSRMLEAYGSDVLPQLRGSR